MGDTAWLVDHIRDIPDVPRPGVVFRDITPLLADPIAFATTVDALVEQVGDRRVDKVLGIEARGFILAAPVAYRLSAGFVPVRKAGKLPGPVEVQGYQLEYGTDHLEIHNDGLAPGDEVLVVDDVLATGGTAAAAAGLVEKLGASVAGLAFLIELDFLGGRSRLPGREVMSLLRYT